MFGKDTQQNDQGAQFQAPEPVTPSAPEPTPNATLESDSGANTVPATPPAAPPELPDKTPAPASSAPSTPSAKKSNTLTPPTLSPSPSASAAAAAPVASDDLMNLKQEALQQLSPLISHLDQTPEERFRTTMMMIQATDDSSKIKEAYEAAKQITDDKARAQALLDIVNEINYFTQQNQQDNKQQ